MQQDFEPTAAIAPEPAAPAPEFLHVGRGDDMRKIAVRRRIGATPGLLWLGGLKSDMGGTKAAGRNDLCDTIFATRSLRRSLCGTVFAAVGESI